MASGFSANLAAAAAGELVRQHRDRQQFDGLPPPWLIASPADAYAVQDAFVRQLQGLRGTRTCGYKIALTTPAMRRMVGYQDSISGHLLHDQILESGSTLRADDFCHLLVEFEIAFRMGSDVPATRTPWTRDTILPYVACAYPALEVADDRHADYSKLAGSILTVAADNAWNQGLVLGAPNASFTADGLLEATGVARVDGEEVGRGTGADVMGHPLDALAWLANHLQQRGLPFAAGHLATTGSLVTSKFPARGSIVEFDVGSLGAVELHVS
ncbi:MAG: fumarylacetoacetate hydrolase family protein [Lautropia sp.]|nr:fumarylacetoacetate hydrolase family protein [Lautropia sp.]